MQWCVKKIKRKELEEKNDYPLKYFAVEGLTLEDCRRTITQWIQVNLSKMIIHNIKILVVVQKLYECVCKVSFDCSHRNELQKSRVG